MSCEGTARWSLRRRGRTGTLGDSVATVQASKTVFARPSQAFWSCKVVLAPERQLLHFIMRRICCTPIASHRRPRRTGDRPESGVSSLYRTGLSLGEAGIEQVVLTDLIPRLKVRGTDTEATAGVKGKREMSQ